MPLNKNAFFRYRLIDSYLRKSNGLSRDELARLCGIGIDQIKKDIAFLREEGAPISIKKIDKRSKYYYSVDSYSFFLPRLNLNQLASLEFAANMFSKYDDAEIFRDIQDAIKILLKDYKLNASYNTQNVDFEFKQINRGIEYVLPLNKAIADNKKVSFTYRKAYLDSKIEKKIVNPLLLKESSNMWFLIGKEDRKDKREPRTYSLDRISDLQILQLDRSYLSFDKDTYYKNVFGIARPHNQSQPVDIILSFLDDNAEIVRTRKIHPTQVFIPTDNVNECRIKISVFYDSKESRELKREILKWGDSVEIIEPNILRKDILKIWRRAIKKNNKNTGHNSGS